MLRILQGSEADDFDGITKGMSLGFDISVHTLQYLHNWRRMSFQGHDKQLVRSKP
jgi:hypothetical protein